MNRPLWLDIVYVNAAMLPPVICAAIATRWTGLRGFLGLAAFIGLTLVAFAVWIALIVTWSRLRAHRQ